MLATADCANHYTEQIIYESSWTDNTSNGISWFNLLTAEPIPEETDVTEVSHTPVRNNSASSCSSSSIESCYVVLEIQRPRSLTETSSTVGKDDEDDDEEEEEEMEEMEEEIEELHFAQVNTDEHHVDCDQLAISLTIEVPMEEHVLEHIQEYVREVEEYAEADQPIIQELSNEMLFDQAKSLSRFTKRMTAMSYISKKEHRQSTSSDDDSSNGKKLKKIEQVHEYHLAVNPVVLTEHQPMVQAEDVVGDSNTSLDSIDDKLAPSAPMEKRTTTTFSNLSSQRTSNPTPTQRAGPKMGTTTLTRTFAFDRACMEKYGQGPEQTTPVASGAVGTINKDTGLPPRKSRPTETTARAGDTLQRRSFANTVPNASHVDSEENTIDESESIYRPCNPSTTFGSPGLTKTTSVLCLMKKYARTVTSEYRLSGAHGNTPVEPTLLQVTYLDGRLPLKTAETGELSRKTQTLSNSISSRLNKLGVSKMSSTQDLPSASTSLNKSYRKRVFSRFRSLLESNPPEPAQSIPWQHKTITELFNEKRHRL